MLTFKSQLWKVLTKTSVSESVPYTIIWKMILFTFWKLKLQTPVSLKEFSLNDILSLKLTQLTHILGKILQSVLTLSFTAVSSTFLTVMSLLAHSTRTKELIYQPLKVYQMILLFILEPWLIWNKTLQIWLNTKTTLKLCLKEVAPTKT